MLTWLAAGSGRGCYGCAPTDLYMMCMGPMLGRVRQAGLGRAWCVCPGCQLSADIQGQTPHAQSRDGEKPKGHVTAHFVQS